MTLDIRAGKTTAVVGKSGCGKSTLSDPAEEETVHEVAEGFLVEF